MAVESTPAARRSHLPLPSQTYTSHRNATVASAAVLNRTKIDRMAKSVSVVSSTRWQEEVWRYFDITGELRYATAYEANAVSLARLYAAKLPDDPEHAPTPITAPSDQVFDKDAALPPGDELAVRLVENFLGGPNAQPANLARLDTHLNVAGESWIVAWDDDDEDNDSTHRGRHWHVLSNREISHSSGRWKMRIRGEDIYRPDDSDTLVIRTWTPHPTDSWKPDSPVRALIPILAELESLTKHVSATVDSRLAGAGLLVLPQSMTFISNRDDLDDDEDPFVRELIDAMVTPIADRSSAAALVPLVIKVPDDTVEAVRHILFASTLDPETHNLRTEAIRRIALGLDIPPEILLGLGDANHWSAWQIEDSSIKLHVEPKLRTICNAASTAYLQPALRAAGVENADRYIIWYDTTQIRLRPNRSTDARDLHEDLLISDSARRQAAGFFEDDSPTEDEFTTMLLRKMLLSQPQMAPSILPFLGIDIPPEAFLSPSERLAQNQPVNGNGSAPTNGSGPTVPTINQEDPSTNGTQPKGIANPSRSPSGDPVKPRPNSPSSGRPQVTTTTTNPD